MTKFSTSLRPELEDELVEGFTPEEGLGGLLKQLMGAVMQRVLDAEMNAHGVSQTRTTQRRLDEWSQRFFAQDTHPRAGARVVVDFS